MSALHLAIIFNNVNFIILHFDSLESTNAEAINQVKRGAGEGFCVVANQQTAGRGRHGRIWISEKDAGLYFSIVLQPKIETKFLPLITLMTAIAVSDALENLYALKSDIKWANDIHIKGKKICGILAEMTEANKTISIIVGIGINLTSSNFPAEIADIATSIEAETNKIADKAELLNSLTRFINYFYDVLQSENGAKKIVEEWTKRSTYAFNKAVRATLANEVILGITDGLTETGALRVKTDSGKLKIIQAGDVESLRKVA